MAFPSPIYSCSAFATRRKRFSALLGSSDF
jgi:hypothetical protein